MKYFEPTKEENKILKDFEKDKLARVKEFKKAKELYVRYAKNSLTKTKNINIRLSEGDLYRLKARAAKVGIPYQTLVSSVLHRLVLEEKSQVL